MQKSLTGHKASILDKQAGRQAVNFNSSLVSSLCLLWMLLAWSEEFVIYKTNKFNHVNQLIITFH